MEFHVSRAARERYRFDETLFSLSGNVVFADFAASRRFAQQMNAQRDLAADPALAVRAADLNAMGLIDEVLHHVIALYRTQRNPRIMAEALDTLAERLGHEVLEATLRAFTEQFPSGPMYREGQDATAYLAGESEGRPNREVALEELLLLWLANANPAFAPFGELFDDRPLEEGSAYDAVVRGLDAHFREQPAFGPDGVDLLTLLRQPALEAPTLSEQLAWMRRNWGFAVQGLGDRLTLSLDVLAEEERAGWMRFHATHGGGDPAGGADTSALHGFAGLEDDREAFSSDSDWMPRLVLLAKSTYVWLDQLARRYGRPIWRLDQIPDEELDRLARQGFGGLWLIGLWERSRASQQIKQLRGNPEAVASAYSLMDYRISDDIGGEEGYQDLRDRAAARGLRLASDMVPNHMGIDSRWVVEHPEWFMSRPDAPYPAYTFNGPNLSSDERVGIYLEDHYYDNTDAAVTFKRVDRWSGEERYIYHGNDGTAIPWNDTAQLDYLNPEVREAVIQTILHVARLFPVIRFDAAMTLARKHIARLWYPEPGSAGAIPSRAEFSMSRRDFERAMPAEFWREVVDRVAAEAPDTLLLAEAFWLMEGYFVRTLGMHRVYNSAFMNMLRDEKNAEYRLVMKNTLEFDPQILKRYVNFMNNPDERTAVDQFGKGDKYFGVCTLMVTLPGLPMFGHGQVEGFGERYGMEFRRPKLQEDPDPDLVARHERDIFPLLHRRELFAEVDDFTLYDFETDDGAVNEDVYAYSNRHGHERTLVVYHNRYAETRGRLRRAVGVEGRGIADGLGLSDDPQRFLLLRDDRTGLEHLHGQRELAHEGLRLSLGAYQCHVFLELRELHDADGRFAALAAELDGRGVPSIEAALADLALRPFHDALRAALAPDVLAADDGRRGPRWEAVEMEARARSGAGRPESAAHGEEVHALPPLPSDAVERHLRNMQPSAAGDSTGIYAALALARSVDATLARAGSDLVGGRWLDVWTSRPVFADALVALGVEERVSGRAVDIIGALLLLWPGLTAADDRLPPTGWLGQDPVRRAIGANVHEGITWFDGERFEALAAWLPVPRLASSDDGDTDAEEQARLMAEGLRSAAVEAGYRLEDLDRLTARPADALRLLAGPPPAPGEPPPAGGEAPPTTGQAPSRQKAPADVSSVRRRRDQ